MSGKTPRLAAWGFLLPARGCSGATLARVPPRGVRFLVDIVVVLGVRARVLWRAFLSCAWACFLMVVWRFSGGCEVACE